MERNKSQTIDAEAMRKQFGTGTEDDFVCAVPWGDNRMVLVHRRSHGWRDYIRFRTWNRHRTLHKWYPSRRYFVIPHENAIALADALYAAVNGEESAKPDWLVAREEAEDEQLEGLAKDGADERTVEQARQRLADERKTRI